MARGNIQQLAQAANYMLMRGENPNYKTTAPMPTAGGLIPREVAIGLFTIHHTLHTRQHICG